MAITIKTGSYLIPDGIYGVRVGNAEEKVSKNGKDFVEMSLYITEAEDASLIGRKLNFMQVYVTEATSARVKKFLQAFFPDQEVGETSEELVGGKPKQVEHLTVDAIDLLNQRATIVLGHRTYTKKNKDTGLEEPGEQNEVKEWYPIDDYESLVAKSSDPLGEDEE